ncbi:hypothetical protein CMV_016912 [Castanea mollissima]|uniref:Uncharacterized protein n=1 Tax=Castanea mollissima TaxID=60419 RepID=A0A8J4R5Q1_9ROSI|nr:hypothetical protein CMV_016912 [Castanea mollissima]
MKRNLAVLASTKPPFVPPDDYHRFSSVVADREAEALVVRSPLYIKKHQLGVCIMRAFLSCSSLKKNEQKPQYQEAIILASETSCCN